MNIIILIAFLFVIAIFGLFVQAIPSILNILLSIFILRIFVSYKDKTLKFLIYFIPVSLLLGLNSRIPEILIDM